MNLKQVQGLEIANWEYANVLFNSRFQWPDLKIVYEYEGHLLTGNFLDISEKSINNPHTNTMKISEPFDYEYVKHPQDEKEINSFCSKVLWDFRHSKSIFNTSSDVINYSEHLPEFLSIISKLVNQIDESQYEALNVIPTGVDFLDLEKHFDFYHFPDEATFKPVSFLKAN